MSSAKAYTRDTERVAPFRLCAILRGFRRLRLADSAFVVFSQRVFMSISR